MFEFSALLGNISVIHKEVLFMSKLRIYLCIDYGVILMGWVDKTGWKKARGERRLRMGGNLTPFELSDQLDIIIFRVSNSRESTVLTVITGIFIGLVFDYG